VECGLLVQGFRSVLIKLWEGELIHWRSVSYLWTDCLGWLMPCLEGVEIRSAGAFASSCKMAGSNQVRQCRGVAEEFAPSTIDSCFKSRIWFNLSIPAPALSPVTVWRTPGWFRTLVEWPPCLRFYPAWTILCTKSLLTSQSAERSCPLSSRCPRFLRCLSRGRSSKNGRSGLSCRSGCSPLTLLYLSE